MSDDFQGASFEDADDSLSINLAEVKEQSYEALPIGTYDCIIEKNEYQISKSSGKPMWSQTFQVVDGEYANRRIFNFMSFSEKALGGTKKYLNRIAPELVTEDFNPKRDANELIGKSCRVKVKIEVYEDNPRNKVADILASGSGSDGFLGG